MDNSSDQNNATNLRSLNFENSEEFLNTIFESIPSPIFYKNLEGKYLGCNSAFLDFLGLKRTDIIGKTVCEIASPEIVEMYKEKDDELFNSPGTQTYEWLIKNKDGKIRKVQFNKSTFTDSSGNVAGIIGVISDITERKQAEKELKHHLEIEKIVANISSHFLELHYSKFKNGIDWALKTIGSFAGVERSYLFLFDEKKKSISNTNEWNTDSVSSIKEKLQNIPINIFPWIRNKIMNKEEILINSISDFPFEASSEMEFLKSFSIKSLLAFPVYKKNKIYGFIAFTTSNDVKYWLKNDLVLLKMIAEIFANTIESYRTEKNFHEAQEKYKSLVEQSITGIYIIQDGEFKYVNPKFAEIFGYTQEEIIEHCKVSDLVYKEDLSIVQANLKKRIDGHMLEISYKFRGLKKNGSIMHVEVHGRRVDYLGKPAVIGTILDISAAIEYENSLKFAKEEADKSSRLKSEFLAQISHEIRTPVSALLSFANLIRNEISEFINNEITECFNSMNAAGERIIRTIDLILNMSTIHTNNYELKPKHIDIYEDIILHSQNEWRLHAENKNLELLLENNCSNTKVFSDFYSVSQILINLVDNAIKYTLNGYVKVKLHQIDNKLAVSVEDTGIGISEDFLPNIFDPFLQEEQGYTRKYDGNGLGLALVKEYCEMNDITIQVTSQKNKGSVFTIKFN
jgi:PAS domain S-box-containing protein